MTFRLQYAAISDVGRVRKDNQDSGYAGPWLLTVCDGVGGAARGDLASSTAIGQLRRLDEPPADDRRRASHRLDLVAGALHRASDRIGDLVDEEPALSGTSTTATVALFDGERLAMGHVGDSRAYLFRDHEISQLTSDHTFVQSLIDEGRITEDDARTHPHRNLILKALDGVHEVDPDLFTVELAERDRILLCSDGASGSLDNGRLADILSTGSPDFAAVELVRASLEAGSTDNVTCIVADVVPATDDAEPPTPDGGRLGRRAEAQAPRRYVVLPRPPRRRHRRARAGGRRDPRRPAARRPVRDRHRPGDRPLRARGPRAATPGYAAASPLARASSASPGWPAPRAWSWSQHQYYVGEQDGVVTIFRGVQADLPGIDLSHAYETTNVQVDQPRPLHRRARSRTASARAASPTPSAPCSASRPTRRPRRRGAEMAQRDRPSPERSCSSSTAAGAGPSCSCSSSPCSSASARTPRSGSA